MTSTADRPIAILSAPGSRGDVNPMVAIGAELRRHGFDVVISLAENYAHVATAAGLTVEPIIAQADFDRLISDPNVWKPFSGIRTILRDAAGKFVEPHLDVIRRHHRPQRTVLVAHPLDFASRIHRDFDPTTPMVSIHLSPALVRDPYKPPRLSPWWFEFHRPAWFVRSAYAIADYAIVDRLLSPSVNQTRKRMRLAPVNRILDRWWLSPDLVLAMYPDWFGETRPTCKADWIPCGFPIVRENSDSTATDKFERESIFFTPGTAHCHAHEFFLNAIAACERIGKHCILATSHQSQLPTSLPDHVTAMGYAQLDPLLRTCAAIVHHGGIGTTSMAISTGCPQLICPMAFDQFHNADRVEQLGLGKILSGEVSKRGEATVNALVNALRDLTEDADRQRRCDEFATRDQDFRGAEVAAKAITELAIPLFPKKCC